MKFVFPRNVFATVGLALGLSFGLAACVSPPVEAPKTTVEQQTDVATEQNLKDQVDILFMVDDSGSMAPKQQALRTRFPDLIKVLDEFGAKSPASYHIGVVTSDLGAPGISCGKNRGGKLQQVGAGAATGCAGPTGKNYIDYDQRVGAPPPNLPAGQDLPTTFGCMANVGDKGCGFEAQLESVYRALHDPIAENQGFLRPGALLAVIWVTDEDDCSADASSDLFTANPAYGNLASYRCTRFSIKCDGQFPLPATPVASFASCEAATTADGNKLTDLTKYINFFTQSKAKGGVKDNPRDVVLAAITAAPSPFSTGMGSSTEICGAGVSSCTILNHSCISAQDSAFFGDPAVRLLNVLQKAQANTVADICATDYKSALQAIGKKIVAALQPSCLTAPIADATKPDCVVEDVTVTGGVEVRKSIPFCGSASTKPCWATKQVADCPKICNPTNGQFQQFGVAIDRGTGGMAPPNTTAQVSCATVAIANQDPNAACGGAM